MSQANASIRPPSTFNWTLCSHIRISLVSWPPPPCAALLGRTQTYFSATYNVERRTRISTTFRQLIDIDDSCACVLPKSSSNYLPVAHLNGAAFTGLTTMPPMAFNIRRTMTENFSGSEFLAQWKSPSDIFSVLLILGGDIVGCALAQLAGSRINPVAFSFGTCFEPSLSILKSSNLVNCHRTRLGSIRCHRCCRSYWRKKS